MLFSAWTYRTCRFCSQALSSLPPGANLIWCVFPFYIESRFPVIYCRMETARLSRVLTNTFKIKWADCGPFLPSELRLVTLARLVCLGVWAQTESGTLSANVISEIQFPCHRSQPHLQSHHLWHIFLFLSTATNHASDMESYSAATKILILNVNIGCQGD